MVSRVIDPLDIPQTKNAMHAHRIMTCLIVAATLLAPSLTAAAPPEPSVDQLAGEWRIVDKRGAEKRVANAVEQIVDDINFLIRGVARSKLRAFNAPCGRLAVEVDDEEVAIRCDRRPVADAPLDGKPKRYVSSQRDVLRLRHQLDHGMLRQTFVVSKGKRTSLYRVSPDGNRLTVATYITSPHFKGTARYAVEYERAK